MKKSKYNYILLTQDGLTTRGQNCKVWSFYEKESHSVSITSHGNCISVDASEERQLWLPKKTIHKGVRDISKPVISIHKTDKVCKIPEHAKESNETETLVSLTFAAADKINDILNV